jgi:adenosylhomocysteine nucleosidase
LSTLDMVNGLVVVLVSANSEWRCTLDYFNDPTVHRSPFGFYFLTELAGRSAVIFHGGWGKVSAAAGTQFVIDRWKPMLLLNIGTCGGFTGKVKIGDLLLVEKTLIYDIYERMSDPKEAIDYYSTTLDNSFLCEPLPQPVVRSLLISADQDIDPDLVFKLESEYGAIAADWESGAIAWTASRNNVKCLILRGVSDLVDSMGGEIYESNKFHLRATEVMEPLLRALPNWIRCASWGTKIA